MSKDNDNIANPEFIGGKISRGFDGIGTSTPEDVRKRAEELAAIDGLSPHDVNERYLEQAREELTGRGTIADDVLAEADAMEDRDGVYGESGRHVPNMGPSDENSTAEVLVNQGLDEALEDEMRQGTRKLDREDQGTELGGDGD